MFRSKHRRRVSAMETGELITVQSSKAECDINNIVSLYKKTGIINHIKNSQGQYTDLPNPDDYQLALNTIIQGEQAFEALPASVREKFNNDPERFLRALDDKDYDSYFREIGIKNPLPPEPVPAPAPSGAPAPAGSKPAAAD